jgi:hypothetical protein
MTGVSELLHAEMLRKERLIRSRGAGTIGKRRSEANEGLFPPQAPTTEAAFSIPARFMSPRVSSNVYRQIQDADKPGAYPRRHVTEQDIAEARAYVEALLCVDLTNVYVELVPTAQWDDNAEAFVTKAGRDQHLLFVPEQVGCSATELLVHEFGHTAHFTAQRQNDEPAFFWARTVTAELVAHFCQYNYILERLTRADLMHAMGQFVTATYALSIVVSKSFDSFEKFISSPPAKAFRESWNAQMLRRQFHLFQRDQEYLKEESERGIALVLAFFLIGEKEGMQRFIRLDRVDTPLIQKLKAAFPTARFEDAFEQAGKHVERMLKRCISH